MLVFPIIFMQFPFLLSITLPPSSFPFVPSPSRSPSPFSLFPSLPLSSSLSPFSCPPPFYTPSPPPPPPPPLFCSSLPPPLFLTSSSLLPSFPSPPYLLFISDLTLELPFTLTHPKPKVPVISQMVTLPLQPPPKEKGGEDEKGKTGEKEEDKKEDGQQEESPGLCAMYVCVLGGGGGVPPARQLLEILYISSPSPLPIFPLLRPLSSFSSPSSLKELQLFYPIALQYMTPLIIISSRLTRKLTSLAFPPLPPLFSPPPLSPSPSLAPHA